MTLIQKWDNWNVSEVFFQVKNCPPNFLAILHTWPVEYYFSWAPFDCHSALSAEWLVPSVQKKVPAITIPKKCAGIIWPYDRSWVGLGARRLKQNLILGKLCPQILHLRFAFNHFPSWPRSYQFDSFRLKDRWSFCVCDLKCPWRNQALVLCETLHCEGSSWTWKKLETVSILLRPHHLRSSNLHILRSKSFSISSIFS